MTDKPLNCVGIDPTKQQIGSHDFQSHTHANPLNVSFEVPKSEPNLASSSLHGSVAATTLPLVERVAIALTRWMNGEKLPQVPNWDHLQESTRRAYREQAKAALEACHAEELREALRALLEDTQHRNHDCGDTSGNCPVLAARALLAKLGVEP